MLNSKHPYSGSTDGQQFPPGVKDEDKLYIFATDLCRKMFLNYKDTQDIEGIDALRFVPPPKALQVNTLENIGFCMEIEPDVDWDSCIKPIEGSDELDISECLEDDNYQGNCHDGLLDISKCMKNAPVIISSPHFFQVCFWILFFKEYIYRINFIFNV